VKAFRFSVTVLCCLFGSAAVFAPEAIAFAQSSAKEVELVRTFKTGERNSYQVQSLLQIESRERGLETWIPENVEISYGFSYKITEAHLDGFADIVYSRPVTKQTVETISRSEPVVTLDKTSLNFSLRLSPVNEILDLKVLKTPPKTKPSSSRKKPGQKLNFYSPSPTTRLQSSLNDDLMQELYRLALNVGSLDSALDFSPKLPLEEVKIGDTWQRTVSYQPQKLKDRKDGKNAMQRLDYTFTYLGLVAEKGKSFRKIQAELDLNTDLLQFIVDSFDVDLDELPIKSIPIQMKSSIVFLLDPKTLKTISAKSLSQGSTSTLLKDFPNDPVEETRFKGETNLKLIVPPVKK